MNLLYYKKNNQLIYNALIIILMLCKFNNTSAQEMKFIKKDSSFVIVAEPMNVYEGIYEKGKPYQGYFKEEDQELFTVDYYENGIKKYNYSIDVLQMLQNDEFEGGYKLKLDIKSIYRDGEIYSGAKHHRLKDMVLVEQYQEGKRTGFYYDTFAMHYYNRVSFKIEKDTIHIVSVQNQGYKIKIFQKNNLILSELYRNDSLQIRVQNIDIKASKFPTNSFVQIYEKFKITKGIAYQNYDETGQAYDEARELMQVFNKLEIDKSKDYTDVFDRLLKNIISATEIENEPVYQTMIAEFISDQEGNIKDGICFFNDSKNSYYRIFNNSKVVNEEKVSLDDFQKIFFSYIEKKYSDTD